MNRIFEELKRNLGWLLFLLTLGSCMSGCATRSAPVVAPLPPREAPPCVAREPDGLREFPKPATLEPQYRPPPAPPAPPVVVVERVEPEPCCYAWHGPYWGYGVGVGASYGVHYGWHGYHQHAHSLSFHDHWGAHR